MSYQIRKTGESDISGLQKVFEYFILNSFAAFARKPLPIPVIAEMLKRVRYEAAYTVLFHEEIVGFGMLKPVNPFDTFNRSAELAYFILPEHTGKGIGSQLLQILEKKALENDIVTLLACVSSKNEQSLQFHKGKGFNQCGLWKGVGEKFEHVFDLIWLQKDLIR